MRFEDVGDFFKKNTGRYVVVHRFEGINAISGQKREFKPGETFVDHSEQADGTITIEIDMSFFAVERSIFEAACKKDYIGQASKLLPRVRAGFRLLALVFNLSGRSSPSANAPATWASLVAEPV